MDAEKRKPLPLTSGVSARNQRFSAFIRGSKLRFIVFKMLAHFGLVSLSNAIGSLLLRK